MIQENTVLITCPYCGHEWQDSWEFQEDEGTDVCGDCGMEYNVERHIEVTYTTKKMECEGEHKYVFDTKFIKRREHVGKGIWNDLPESEYKYYHIHECSVCDDKKYEQVDKEKY